MGWLFAIVALFFGAIIVGVLWFFGLYNGLVTSKNKTQESWAQIDVQLKRRFDLIPNLLETVKGYMKHEKELLEGISRARAGLVSGNPAQAAAADQQVSQGLRQVWAVAESYPDLKSSANFGKLQDELGQTENAIAHARQGYNEAVLNYNNKTQMVPSNIVANMFNMRPVEFFRVASETEREVVKVQF